MKVGDVIRHKEEPWPDCTGRIIRVMKMNNVIVIKLHNTNEVWVCKRSAVDLLTEVG